MKTIALIDYGSGNVHSAARALASAAADAGGDWEVALTAEPSALRAADRIVLPGVGHFRDCMEGVQTRDGLVEALEEQILDAGKPFLGICVGMQLMADFGLEDGETRGLGWIHGQVDKIDPGPGFRVPHMGWNELSDTSGHPALANLPREPHAYFVHSYAFQPEEEERIAAVTDYGTPIIAAVARDNLFGTQFHPEKSQETGLKILQNWIRWRP
ncbi:MAG: imidazole glycerol phosphate synthase subunit HisH [Pseudomonadota bacterium]